MASGSDAEGRRRRRVGGVAARRGLDASDGGAAGVGAGGAVAARAAARQRAALGRPDRRPGTPDRDRYAGRDRRSAGAPGDPRAEPGRQGRLAGRVRHPARSGQRTRLPDHLLPPDGRHPGDDRRQTRRPGPQPRPRPAGGVAVRSRTRRLRRPVGRRSRLDRASRAAVPAAVRRAPRTCSPGCRWACRCAGR